MCDKTSMGTRIFAILFAVSCLMACTSNLKVSHVEKSASGVMYAVPFTQYQLDVVTQVSKCEVDEINLTNTITVTPRLRPDPDHLYSIDVTSLTTFTNNAATSVEFFEDTLLLKSLNAEADDKTLEIVGSVIGAAVKIAAAYALPTGAPAVLPGRFAPTCLVMKEFANVTAQDQKVKGLINELDESTRDAVTLAAKIAKAEPNALPSDKAKLAHLMASIVASQLLLEQEKEVLVKRLKNITYSKTIYWPESGSITATTNGGTYKVPETSVARWWGIPGQNYEDRGQEVKDVHKQLISNSMLSARIELDDTIGMETPQSYSGALDVHSTSHKTGPKNTRKVTVDHSAKAGIRYRVPSNGVLIVCKGGDPSCSKADESSRHAGPVVQLGYLNTMPIQVKPFSKAKYEATWSAKGYLTKAGYTQSRSSGEALAGFAGSVADQYKAYSEAKAGEEQAMLDGELKRLTTLAEIKTKQALLAETTEEAAALAATQAQTTKLLAKIALLEAERKLGVLKAMQGT